MMSHKKLILGLFLIGSLAVPVFKTTAMDEISDLDSKKTIAVNFDLHDVLFEGDTSAKVKKGLTYLAIGGICSGLGYLAFGRMGLYALGLIPSLIGLDLAYSFSKQEYRHEENAFKNSYLAKYLLPEYIQLESMFKPNEKMFEFAKELKSKGYIINIASNVNDGSLNVLMERYPDHLSNELFSEILSPKEDNGYLNKRYKEDKNDEAGKAYFEALTKMNEDAEIVFYIDDKAKNCYMAQTYIGKKCKGFVFNPSQKTLATVTYTDSDKKEHTFPTGDRDVLKKFIEENSKIETALE